MAERLGPLSRILEKETTMASPNDVMAILKAVSVKLDADTIAILSFMYHTELDPSDPAGKKKDRSKSQYRYEGRVVKIADLQNEISKMKAEPDAPWRWPTLETWRASYDNEATNKRGAKWLESRIKKALDPDIAFKVLNGWKPSKNDYKDNRKYDLLGYQTPDGNTIDITPETLPTLTTFSKILTPKRA